MGGIDGSARSSTGVPLVELRDVSKHFRGVQALEGINLEIPSSAVHALVGENGAGKSTLGKIIAGALQHDGGSLLIDGRELSLRAPREGLGQGIAMMAQELLVVGHLTVAQNVFLGVEPRSGGWINRRLLRQRYEKLADQAGFALPADRLVGGLRVAEQQQVEIMRALARDARMIVMDEPSQALAGADVERLHDIIRSLAAQGRTVLLVSHFLREVLELADTITVMRDGRIVRSGPATAETEASLIQGMLGRPLNAVYPPKAAPRLDAPVALAVRELSASGVAGVSFDLREGEILGLAGLVGAGRSELARAIFGADRRLGGAVELAGEPLPGSGPLTSLRRGLAMVPESRRDLGLLFSRSAIENVSLSSLADHSRLGIVDRRAERAVARELLTRVSLTRASGESIVGTLSGGNQQKVLFARMLMCRPKVLIADEPTRGVDVGAKRAIYDLIVALAAGGTAVLLISSELEEVLGLAQRVLVMRRGRIARELSSEEMSESTILAAAFSENTITEAA
ncbi:MAG TPA: sugar ABC transporter ATP-binding protein [Solirubrobacteraceae bacterium]|jgi:simple sugar transport system ATP-binding protein/ribose transport system ATP-binding protein|nr:sugar ABC transporter ATP-binding protein [Solirubrobacteraceae bacterium]